MANEFFDLDPNRLDQEWVEQPGLYHKYALLLAEASQRVAEAKAQLEITEADVEKSVRDNPVMFGIDKVTEGAIKIRVALHQRVIDVKDRLIQAKYEEDVAQAAVRTLDHRKKALEDLVQLRLADYFSEPRVKGQAREKMATASKNRTDRRVNERLNRKLGRGEA